MAENWCRICGKKYKVCDRCDTARNRTPWRVIADTAEHYQIWIVIRQYKQNLITKQKAKEMLSNIPFQDELDTFIPAVRDTINSIMTDAESTNENVSNVSKKPRRRGRTK